jgi:lipoprotein signal peptidase
MGDVLGLSVMLMVVGGYIFGMALPFHIHSYMRPGFNVADAFCLLGALLLIGGLFTFTFGSIWRSA